MGPTQRDIDEQNRYLLRRQKEFLLAARFLAAECSSVDAVEKIVLFGSVANALEKEVPRFREYRTRGIRVWHECKDIDVAVWVTDLSCMRSLQKARSRAINELLAREHIGVAHHQLDAFIMQHGTDRYLGRLCTFARCPRDKPECLTPGCGDVPLLKQHEQFVLLENALHPDRSIVLFERSD